MTKISEIIDCFDREIPFSAQDSWDNSGFLLGDRTSQVRGVLLSLDVTEKTIDEAIMKGCNLVISHHPILFKGIRQIEGATDEQRLIAKAIKNDVAILSLHTCLDRNINGLSMKLGEKIGLQNMSFLEGNYDYGYGIVGELNEELDVKTFLEMVKETLGLQVLRYNNYKGIIQRVAICTGSGAEFIRGAVNSEADAYITADLKYHNFTTINEILLVDIGHFESEVHCKEIFYNILIKNFSNFAPYLSEEMNPINYL